MLALLTLVHVFYALDRTIPSIVAEPVKQAFLLSDTQLGLLLGLAYGASFAVASLFIGPVIDRSNRIRLVALMLLVWSAATAVSGLATGFVMLLVMRVLVGIAEAGSSPAAFSLISDVFPAARRGTAIGVYKIGAPVGILLASLIGGFLAQQYGWRAAFLVAGIPGLLLAFVAWRYLSEPPRESSAVGGPAAAPASVREVALALWNLPGAVPLILGIVTIVFSGAGVSAFVVPFLQRVHGMSLAEAGTLFALASSLGTLTPLALGMIADRLAHGGLHRSLWFSAMTAMLALACGLLMLLAPSQFLATSGLILWQMLVLGVTTPNYAALLSIVPSAMRGTVTALLMLGTNLVGLGGAPTVVGMLSDLMGGGLALRQALVIVLCFAVPAALLFARSAIQLRRESVRRAAVGA